LYSPPYSSSWPNGTLKEGAEDLYAQLFTNIQGPKDIAPTGRVARVEGWHFPLWGREQLTLLQDITGFIMVGLVLLHFAVNYKLYRSELKGLFKRKR